MEPGQQGVASLAFLQPVGSQGPAACICLVRVQNHGTSSGRLSDVFAASEHSPTLQLKAQSMHAQPLEGLRHQSIPRVAGTMETRREEVFLATQAACCVFHCFAGFLERQLGV